MNVLLRSDNGPIEGFERCSFRVAINDTGVGEIAALPDVIDGISGPVVVSIDGVDVFAFRIDERDAQFGDRDLVVANGRGIASSLERVIVLPLNYPAYTERTRDIIGAPFGVWATLLVEAQTNRSRALFVNPTWTSSNDSNGDLWTENIRFQLDPGVNLLELLNNVSEVETADWLMRPNGDLVAARDFGIDRSAEVVLFVGATQLSRGLRESLRNQRQTVFLEASTGVSEVSNSAPDDAGEIWLEGQDFADPLSRQAVAEKLADRAEFAEREVEVAVSNDCGIFDTFDVGDVIGLDVGSGSALPTRVIGATVDVNASNVDVELTLVSDVELRQTKIDRAIEAKADVRLAASATLQRRHGLVTADKFLSGAVGDDVAIASENYLTGVQGWVIRGDGDAEFNNVVIRGDLESNNYVADVSGWRLDQDGDAELNEGKFRGLITGSAFTTDDGSGAGHVVISGNPALDPESPGVNQIAFIPDSTFFPFYAAPALVQVLDTGGMALSSVAGSSPTDATVLLLRTNGIDLNAGPNGFQGIGISAPDGPIDLTPATGVPVTVYGNLDVTGNISGSLAASNLTGTVANARLSGSYTGITGTGTLNAGSISSGFGNINIGSSTFTGNGSGLTNLPTPALPSDPTFNSVRVNTSLFFNTATFPRFEQSGTGVQLRGTGQLRMKFNGGFRIEDGPLTFDGGSISVAGNASLQDVTALTVRGQVSVRTDPNDTTTLAVNTRINTSTGRIQRSTSSMRYKQDIADAPLLDLLLDVRPQVYRGIADVEELGDEATVSYGAIAEELHDLGLHALLQYLDGVPESIHYDRMAVALIPHVRQLRHRIEALEEITGGS